MKVKELNTLLGPLPDDAEVLVRYPYDQGNCWGHGKASWMEWRAKYPTIIVDEEADHELFRELHDAGHDGSGHGGQILVEGVVPRGAGLVEAPWSRR